jgi:hypothetical protein
MAELRLDSLTDAQIEDELLSADELPLYEAIRAEMKRRALKRAAGSAPRQGAPSFRGGR